MYEKKELRVITAREKCVCVCVIVSVFVRVCVCADPTQLSSSPLVSPTGSSKPVHTCDQLRH